MMRPTRLAVALAVVAGLGLAVPATAGKAAPFKGAYLVGADVQSINPTPAMIKAGDFYLGGYGLGSGKALNKVPVIDGRAATGVLKDPLFRNGLADGVHVRSIVIGAGGTAIALSQIETQGMFVAYKQGPFGLVDIRKDAAAAIAKLHGPAISAGSILVDSNHTHAGPDTAGVWGGVPTTYLKLVHDQTVKSIVNAYKKAQRVDLYYGTAHAGVAGEPKRYPSKDPLLTNQFSRDPVNQEVDDELRVLQARGPKGKVVATYLNYSSHPTVLGGSNTLVSADYTGPLAAMLSTLGGTGMEQVATLGRTQPARDDCPDKRVKGSAADVCKINSYASRVFARTKQAIKAAKPVPGTPLVALHSYFIQDLATNAPIIALTYGGLVAGAPIYRAANAPWIAGTVLGTSSFSGRIGDILLSGGPGEMYPQIVQQVRERVPAFGHINIGTAGDFLGYIIAPFGAYPEPVRRSMFDGEAPPVGSLDCSGGASPVPIPSPIGCPDPISNDNYFFNASHTMGERLTCALLRGAGETMKGDPQAYWTSSLDCPLFANDLALPADTDTTFPAQPDLSALPGFDH
ncbi:MAG: hypothetical protein JWM40_832 [Frankiales bacterium]|nr:hypothetical protein [Frankiales bacterium]